MISSIVIQLSKPNGLRITYINDRPRVRRKRNTERMVVPELRAKQHKCRIKEVVYGGVFGYYCEGMDFTLSLQSGSKIVVDNREKFGYTVLGRTTGVVQG